jgi:hypothetical protein
MRGPAFSGPHTHYEWWGRPASATAARREFLAVSSRRRSGTRTGRMAIAGCMPNCAERDRQVGSRLCSWLTPDVVLVECLLVEPGRIRTANPAFVTAGDTGVLDRYPTRPPIDRSQFVATHPVDSAYTHSSELCGPFSRIQPTQPDVGGVRGRPTSAPPGAAPLDVAQRGEFRRLRPGG